MESSTAVYTPSSAASPTGSALDGSGYSLKGVGREGFNGAQLGDTATVANLGDRLAVYDVETRSDWSNSSSVSTFDFAEKYPSFQ